MLSCTRALARSVADPFSFSACVPDGSNGSSVFSLKETGTAITGAAGSCVSIFAGGNIGNTLYNDTGSAAATITIGANWANASSRATIIGQYTRSRLVSMGLKLTFTGNTTADQGVMYGYQFGGAITLAALNGANGTAAVALSQYYKMAPARSGMQVIWRPNDPDDQGNYVDIGNATATAATTSIPFIGITVFSASATSPFTWELVANYEGQLRSSTFYPGGLAPRVQEPAEPGWYENAKNLVAEVDPVQILYNRVTTGLSNWATSQLMGPITRPTRAAPRPPM